jgi:hypothetical protein
MLGSVVAQVALLAFVTPAAPEAAEAPTQAATKVLVLEPKAPPELSSTAKLIQARIAQQLDEEPGLDILSSEDLATLMEIESSRALTGCETDSCMLEIAAAMGSRFVVFSRIDRLGERLILNAILFDSTEGRAVTRKEIEAKDATDLAEQTGELSELLLDPLRAQLGQGEAAAAKAEGDSAARSAAAPGDDGHQGFLPSPRSLLGFAVHGASLLAVGAGCAGAGAAVIVITTVVAPAVATGASIDPWVWPAVGVGVVLSALLPAAGVLGTGVAIQTGWWRTIPAAVLAGLGGLALGTLGSLAVIWSGVGANAGLELTVTLAAFGGLTGALVGGALGAATGFALGSTADLMVEAALEPASSGDE